jgi:type VI secretion system secreted protein VgrG
MTAIATQDGRVAVLTTPLAKDALLFSRMDTIEGMGELFEFRIEALSQTPKDQLNFDDALGRNCSVHLNTSDTAKAGRDFSGVLTEIVWTGQGDEFDSYRLILRPWLWLLSLTSDCKIFQNMTPKDIILQVFKDRKFDPGTFVDSTNLTHDYPTLEYTVQYEETDLNFVHRLMEEYGIYYYFKFGASNGSSPSDHVLVLADSISYTQLPNLSEVKFLPTTGGVRDYQYLNGWSEFNEMVTGKYTLNDYDYQGPGKNLVATSQYNYKFQHGDMEIYKYIGDYNKQSDGQNLADVARDVERTRNLRCAAHGYAPTLTPGYKVTRTTVKSSGSQSAGSNLSQNASADDGDYLLLRCSHSYGYQTYASATSSSAATDGAYIGNYELAKSSLPYRMAQHTRRPFIAGTQSALVVGKQGEEIDVDEQGRIAVVFYWDRKKSGSRRIRVAQFWAGQQRGSLYLPRIGDEVLIQYDEGDPDRPLVVGSVYNGSNTVPTPLPAKKTHSGILTRSSKGGGGYNMLLFEDLTGSEFVKLRTQKDLMFKAVHDQVIVIGNDRSDKVANDVNQQIGNNQNVKVGTNKTENVGTNYSMTAGTQITLTVGASSITMDSSSITLAAPTININGDALVSISAPMVKINS